MDVAADPAVISTVRDALKLAIDLKESADERGYAVEGLPWLMVSLNDGEDPHFRKAEFDATQCPANCSRPCEPICPVQAIVFDSVHHGSGVIDSLCYGCGRCLTVCPVQHITARSYVSSPAAVAPLVLAGVDAVEIHTQVGRLADFKRLWQAIEPYVENLKLVAISCPDDDQLIDYLWSLYDLVSPLPCSLIWQTDGRPMSGDIGDGATRAAIKLGQKVLAAKLPGYVQLAGGTNRSTVEKLRALNLLKPALQTTNVADSTAFIAGVAYGSYARSLLLPLVEEMEKSGALVQEISQDSISSIRLPIHRAMPAEYADLLWQSVDRAHQLVSELKQTASISTLLRSAE
ncbi:MAG: 4Fe-4S ferredoxin [Elainella sp. Prado103]|nr:4Fe-4S ferredoxin [Elainella sp. Prado103]